MEELQYQNELYLTVVPPVSSGKNNIHCIRHDVDRSLVFLPIFGVGFLSEKYNCQFDILDINVGKWILTLLSRKFYFKYLIHNLIVGGGQCQIHRLQVFSEPEVTRMLTVMALTEDLASCFGFLNIQRSNRNPSYSSNEALIVTLVLVLREKIKSTLS